MVIYPAVLEGFPNITLQFHKGFQTQYTIRLVYGKVVEYRSGIYDCVQMRHVVHPVFVSSLGGPFSSQIFLYCDKVE